MKSLAPSTLLSLALIAPSTQAAAPDPSLLGCWRAVRIVLHTADGKKAQDTSGRCSLHFTDNQFESSCMTSGGTSTTTYKYEIVRPGVYQSTLASSTLRTDLAGSKREYEYRVDGDTLVTVTHPRVQQPASPMATVSVELEAARTPCQ